MSAAAPAHADVVSGTVYASCEEDYPGGVPIFILHVSEQVTWHSNGSRSIYVTTDYQQKTGGAHYNVGAVQWWTAPQGGGYSKYREDAPNADPWGQTIVGGYTPTIRPGEWHKWLIRVWPGRVGQLDGRGYPFHCDSPAIGN
jgi:hypothetical protein